MIPKIIHYCWFGRGPMPAKAIDCIESWRMFMPDYEYKLWNEDNFDVTGFRYTKEAYEAGRYAFVSDVARLVALKEYGGIYMDVDFRVYKSFDPLLRFRAFAGFEGSKTSPVMMGVIATEPGGEWVTEQLDAYSDRSFLIDGKEDLTTNVRFITDRMRNKGFVPNGKEQDFDDLHIFPVDYFCPRLTTGEYVRSANTYCEQIGSDSSWAGSSFKVRALNHLPSGLRVLLIKAKRILFG